LLSEYPAGIVGSLYVEEGNKIVAGPKVSVSESVIKMVAGDVIVSGVVAEKKMSSISAVSRITGA
jgi:hypothetical protein